MTQLKQCNICNEHKEVTMFYKQKHGKYVVRALCKSCNAKKAAEYFKLNKNKLYQQAKEYKLKTNYWANWWIRNRDRLKNKHAEYNKEWASKNQDKIRYYSRVRRQKKHLVGDKEHVSKELESKVKIKFNNKCFKCGDTGTKSELELDHFYPLSKGHKLTEENCVLLCKSCNSSKHNKLPEKFFSEEELIMLKSLGVGRL